MSPPSTPTTAAATTATTATTAITATTATTTTPTNQNRNQLSLPSLLLQESLIGTLSALSITPLVTIIDKAIVSNASGLQPLLPSIVSSFKGLISNPIAFVKNPAFLLIWGVYSGTYIVGNITTQICTQSSTSPFYPKFILGSITNVSLSLFKDRKFAEMFKNSSTGNAPLVMSRTSLSLFALRDSMTILSSFSLPPVLSQRLQDTYGVSKNKADVGAQLFCPCFMQVFSTPAHLYGLDLFNRPALTGAGGGGRKAIIVEERMAFVKREYVKTVAARVARILPAFGIGGVINKNLRIFAFGGE